MILPKILPSILTRIESLEIRLDNFFINTVKGNVQLIEIL